MDALGSRRALQPAAIAALGLWILLQAVGSAAVVFGQPPYDTADSAYYFAAGSRLARGEPVESVVVSHLNVWESVHHPPFDHWQPGLAIGAAASMAVLGSEMRGAQWTAWWLGSLAVPALALVYVRWGGGSLIAALCSAATLMGLSALDVARYRLESTTLAGALILAGGMLLARASEQGALRPRTLAFFGSAVLGISTTVRGDALPVAALVLCSIVASDFIGRRTTTGTPPRMSIPSITLGFGATTLPLVLRNLLVFGRPFPPGSAAVPWLTEYEQWNRFPPPEGIPAPAELLEARVESAIRAFRFALEAPPSWLCTAMILLVLVWLGKRAPRPLSLMIPIVFFASSIATGVLLAPAVTLWNDRSGEPYIPILVAGGFLAADRLVSACRAEPSGRRNRKRPSVYWIGAAAVLSFCAALIAQCSVDPLRRVGEPTEIKAACQRAAIVVAGAGPILTDLPLPLYVERDDVVRIPNNGWAALVAAAEHYRASRVVLFRRAQAWAGPELQDLWSASSLPLPPGHRLTIEHREPEFRVYRLERTRVTPTRTAPGPSPR